MAWVKPSNPGCGKPARLKCLFNNGLPCKVALSSLDSIGPLDRVFRSNKQTNDDDRKNNSCTMLMMGSPFVWLLLAHNWNLVL